MMELRKIQIALWDTPIRPFIEFGEFHLRFHLDKTTEFGWALNSIEQKLDLNTIDRLQLLWSDDNYPREFLLEGRILIISD
jgi:hypothetical protein